jgi:hypothetical protein
MKIESNDGLVTVTKNVNPEQDGLNFKYRRTLDCIKITVNSPNAHFIQFCTRQYPDLFTYEDTEGKTVQWDKVTYYHMEDSINPKWKLDVTNESSTCYYEEGGLHKTTENDISLYDDPSGSYEMKEERAVFCTFILLGNKITHLVKWSREFILNEKGANYSAEIEKWGKELPLWAVIILNSHYKSGIPTEIGSKELVARATKEQPHIIQEESRKFFLTPPNNWVTLVNYPEFFSNTIKLEQEEQLTTMTSLKK